MHVIQAPHLFLVHMPAVRRTHVLRRVASGASALWPATPHRIQLSFPGELRALAARNLQHTVSGSQTRLRGGEMIHIS